MLITRLIYLALIIGTGLFAVLYIDALSLLLFLVTLALPLFLFLLLLLARVLTKITVELEKTVGVAGEPVKLMFKIRNFSFVALPNARVRVHYIGGFENVVERDEITFPLNALTKQTLTCDLNSKHIGVVRLYIENIILQDYFGLFALPIKVGQEHQITFMPEVLPVELEMRPNILMNDDSDVFSKTKKGDDPSEVFAIREYVGGDKLNRIHWKLSSKQDTLMVKDYSLPINNKVVLLLELGAPTGDARLDKIDAAVQTVISISHFLCDAEIIHHICWYDCGSERFFNEEITSRDDIYAALGAILSSKIGQSANSLFYWARENMPCSHMVYVTSFNDEAVLETFSELSFATLYTLFKINDGVTPEEGEFPSNIQPITVNYNQVANALLGITL